MWNKLYIFLWLISENAEARPQWIDRRPVEDASYRYYVGRSGIQGEEKKAYELATQDAYDGAIRENFGVHTKVDLQTFETEKESKIAKHIENSTPTIQLKGFEQVDTYQETEGDAFNLWALFRYKKTEIESERERMSRMPVQSADFAEVGDKSSPNTGILEITSEPPGAEVRIGGEKLNFQKTPIRMYGLLSVGPHQIEIDHPNYEVAKRTTVMMMGRRVEINQRLIRARAKLNVTTSPINTKIFLNGKYRGMSPIEGISLKAGEEVRVEAKHEDIEAISQAVTLTRDETRDLDLNLTLKPHALREYLEKEEKKSRQQASLEVVSTAEVSVPQTFLEPRTSMGINIYYRTPTLDKFEKPTYSLGISVHHKFTSFFGVEGEVMYGVSEKAEFANGSVQQQTMGLRGGVGIFPFSESHFYIGPEVVHLGHLIEIKAGELDFTGTKARLSQTGYGAGISWFSFDEVRADRKPTGGGIRFSVHQLLNGPLCYTLGVSLTFGL